MKSYGVGIIGTSPLTIIEACFLKKIEAKSVVNIDERSVVGGAWTTVHYEGFPEIESGCHIWSYEKSTYTLIKKLLNVNLVALSPQPSIAYKGFLIPYDYKANVLSVQRLVKGFRNIREVLKAPDVRFTFVPSKYLYPHSGAFDLKNSLKNIVSQNSLELELNTVIDTVVVSKEGVLLLDKDNKELMNVGELVLTSLSSIRLFVFEGGEEVRPTTRKAEYIHVHFILKNVKGKPFSYIRTNGDKVIHRLSDMTSQVQEQLELGEQLFCAGIFADAFHKMKIEEIKEYIYNYLIRYKLINNSAEILKVASNIYPSYYNRLDEMKAIERLAKGKIRFLRSTDFVYSFFNQKERYSKLLSSNSK